MDLALYGGFIRLLVRSTIYFCQSTISKTCPSNVFSLLSSFIPVIRNKSEWQEFVTAGAVSGTLAGYLFSDRKALGFTRIKQTGRLTYKQLCIGRGLLYGLLMGAVLGANDCLSNGSGAASQLRKWEDHWKQRKLVSYKINESTVIFLTVM